MATQRSMIKPTNKIVLDSQNLHIQTMKVQTATMMYAGRLVKKGTNDDDAVVNTSGGAAIGWLGYEQITKKYRPSTVDTIYAGDEQAAILSGPGIVVVGSLVSGETVTKGTMLYGADNGQLQDSPRADLGAGGAGEPVAVAEESVAATTSTTDILVRSLI